MLQELRERLRSQGCVSFCVKVTPRARRTEWGGVLADGTPKLSVAAVPEEGRANEAVLRFIAEQFEVARGQVRLVSGSASTRKVVAIRLS